MTDLLTDLQSRTQSEPDLLALVQDGRDADVARWYADTDSDSSAIRPTPLRSHEIALRLGAADTATILGKLRGVAGSNPVVAEGLTILDRGDPLDFGHDDIRGMVETLTQATVLTEGEMLALHGLGQSAQSLSVFLFGRTVTADDVSAALSPVRVGSTSQLIPDWQSWSAQ